MLRVALLCHCIALSCSALPRLHNSTLCPCQIAPCRTMPLPGVACLRRCVALLCFALTLACNALALRCNTVASLGLAEPLHSGAWLRLRLAPPHLAAAPPSFAELCRCRAKLHPGRTLPDPAKLHLGVTRQRETSPLPRIDLPHRATP